MKHLVIFDGYSLFFRAHYGVVLKKSDDSHIGAVYGFLKIFFQVLAKFKDCSHVLIALDSGGGGFREEICADYKKNRKECPCELKPQFAILDDCIKAMNVSSERRIGFEADDIISSYAHKSGHSGDFKTTIVTSDKDLCQLVCDQKNVSIYDHMKNKILDEMAVSEKFGGVLANQVRDFLAIVGDASDNVQGILGIGEKTAQSLLKRFGNLENIYKNVEYLGSKRTSMLLLDGIAALEKAKKLVSLQDVGDVLDVDLFVKPDFKNQNFINFLELHEMKSIIRML